MNMATPDLKARGAKTVVVVSVDQREYVLSKQSEPSYIATARGGYGNPFSEYTSSGKAVAEEITNVICNALKKNGFTSMPVYVAPSAETQEAEQALKEKGGEKSLLVQIKEMRGDVFMGDRCYCDLSVKIFDKAHNLLVQNKVKYEGSVGFSMGRGGAAGNIIGKIRDQLEELLNKQEVINALQ